MTLGVETYSDRVLDAGRAGTQRQQECAVLSIVPARTAAWLFGALVVLLIAHGLGLFFAFGLGHSYVYGFVPLFDFGRESNIPTFFSTSLFLFNALLFALVAISARWETKEKSGWLILAAVFAFLALDEFAMIHEKFIAPVRELLGSGGYLYFAWVIPYVMGAALLALVTAPLIWSLGWRFRLLFGLAAGAFLTGAVGVEMLGGRYFEAVEETIDLRYRLFQTVEESLEFTGLIILVYTLLVLRASLSKQLLLRLELADRPLTRSAARSRD